MTTPRLALPTFSFPANPGLRTGLEKYNALISELDAFVNCTVISKIDDPPLTPALGDTYRIGATPSGAWAARDEDDLAAWVQSALIDSTVYPERWVFKTPPEGYTIWDRSQAMLLRWDGAAFVDAVSGSSGAPTVEYLEMDATDSPDDWTLVGAGSKVAAVQSDNDSEYIKSSTDQQVQRFFTGDPSLFDSADTVDDVQVEIRVKNNGGSSGNVQVAFRIPPNNTSFVNVARTSSFVTNLTTTLTRPGGGSWTHDDFVDTLRVLIRQSGTEETHVSRVRVKVNFTPA